ncbi:hypothetical protein VNO77_08022 [Canavalia gladiata]|uniref:Uncharacterized protein n=1 Tax=Canavalia gladiata TaxID=3824 RepID=A0AAN9QW24_CANGL
MASTWLSPSHQSKYPSHPNMCHAWYQGSQQHLEACMLAIVLQLYALIRFQLLLQDTSACIWSSHAGSIRLGDIQAFLPMALCLWFLLYGILDEGEKSPTFSGATEGIVKVLCKGFGFSLILFKTSVGRPFLLSFYEHPQSHLCEGGFERISRLWEPVRARMGVLSGAGCRKLGNPQVMQLQGLSTPTYPDGVGHHRSALVRAWLGVTFYVWLGLKTTPAALSFSAITLSKGRFIFGPLGAKR